MLKWKQEQRWCKQSMGETQTERELHALGSTESEENKKVETRGRTVVCRNYTYRASHRYYLLLLTAINDRIIVANALGTAIYDCTLVFEYQPISVHPEYAWPSSLSIAQHQQSQLTFSLALRSLHESA